MSQELPEKKKLQPTETTNTPDTAPIAPLTGQDASDTLRHSDASKVSTDIMKNFGDPQIIDTQTSPSAPKESNDNAIIDSRGRWHMSAEDGGDLPAQDSSPTHEIIPQLQDVVDLIRQANEHVHDDGSISPIAADVLQKLEQVVKNLPIKLDQDTTISIDKNGNICFKDKEGHITDVLDPKTGKSEHFEKPSAPINNPDGTWRNPATGSLVIGPQSTDE